MIGMTYLTKRVGKYVAKMLACKPPTRVYALYLKEQWFELLIERIPSHYPIDMNNPWDFCEIYFTFTLERHNLMCQFYLHKL